MNDIAVWFDLDGTLLAFDDYDAVVERACDEVRIDPTDAFLETYYDRFFDAFRNYHPNPFRAGVERAIAAAGSDADPEEFVDALRRSECDAAATSESVRSALAELTAADDVSLGVLTNGVDDWQAEKLDRNGLSDYFDTTLTSYEVGVHKPAPKVFTRAEELLPADEYVMVGDDREADVAAARERGWRAVHVEGPGEVADAIAEIR